jgi:hypothetical protein
MNDELKPLSYDAWLSVNGLAATDNYEGYSKYLVNWYKAQGAPRSNIKDDYVQLLKDIKFLFKDEKKDPFIADLNLDIKEDLINALPYFTNKIKNIIKGYTIKRESVKKSKLKYNLSSSSRGIEILLYEYLLRSFTSRGNLIPVAYNQLSDVLPQLKNVNNTFYIEIEELYDKSNYFDQSPVVESSNYVDIEALLNSFPYQNNLTEDQLLGLLSTALKPRIANTPLSELFLSYLYIDGPGSINEYDYLNAVNNLAANQKYLGRDLYGLTAIKTNLNEFADYTVNLNIEQGNNWFYWPSGDKIYNYDYIDNIYHPIEINSTNFVLSGATGGSSYQESDLIFTDKKGYIEGAWLMGPRTQKSKHMVSFSVDSNERRQFLWPYTGFELTKITNQWKGHSLNDDSNKYFYFLPNEEKNFILEKYYSLPTPSLTSLPVYLNETGFYNYNVLAGESTVDSDVIIKQKTNKNKNAIYNASLETNDGTDSTEISFLYKFENTDLPITSGINNIIWPLKKIADDLENIPVTVDKNFCLPVRLLDTDVSKSFQGAVAGLTYDMSDIIYKLDGRDGNPVEAAWLRASNVSDLNTISEEIPIYSTKADPLFCAKYIQGAQQTGLHTTIRSGKKISFIWGDVDTPVDEVIRYREHQINCPYSSDTGDYYDNQDYLNPIPLRPEDFKWKKCNCRSVNYSPIGHKGNIVTEYGGVTDMLFADPQGMEEDFAFNTWKDTRGLDYKNSPQFSFYQLNENNSNDVGWGYGKWKTSTGSKMILKTGRRYTYCRTKFKTLLAEEAPLMVLNYYYKNPPTTCINTQPYDMVLVIDISMSQKENLDLTKRLVEGIILDNLNNAQIAIVVFDENEYRCSYLSNTPDLLDFYNKIDRIDYSGLSAYRTNLYGALQLANELLTKTITEGNQKSIIDFNRLCKDINATIRAARKVSVLNMPQPGALKRIFVISDGVETKENTKGKSLPYSKDLKNSGVEIHCVDVGQLSKVNNLLEEMASPGKYFDLQRYIEVNDNEDYTGIIRNISQRTNNCQSMDAVWMKLVRDTNGEWTETTEFSDMVLNPGDFLTYIHRDYIEYTSPYDSYQNFRQPSVNFKIKLKLGGWDYLNNRLASDGLSGYFGAKPFWGKAYLDIDPQNNFDKGTQYLGGHIRWLDYMPLEQPEVSMTVLENGDFIEYIRNKTEKLSIKEEVPFEQYLSDYRWNKLEFSKQYSNLNNLFKHDKIDYIVKQTQEASDMIIEGFYEFKPAKYNYYARSPFTFGQDLFLINKCLPTYSSLLTGMVLEAESPYKHLDNVNFPTVATLPYTNNFVSKKQVGEYRLPTRLGVPFFNGRGYTIELDEKRIAELEQNNVEKIFLDPQKYGPIVQGLSKTDHYSPVKISSIDNRWMMIPYGTGMRSGTINNTVATQKFTGYQSDYEVYGSTIHGPSKASDDTQFYDSRMRWTGKGINYRGELSTAEYQKRRKGLLVSLGTTSYWDLGIITQWRTDLFGFNYALFKTKLDANNLEYNIADEEENVRNNDPQVYRENMASNRKPQDQEQPEFFELINYNSRAQDYLDFVIDEEE